MIKFLYSEEWWMDVVVTAAIISSIAGVFCAVAGAIIAKKGHLTNIGGMIQNTDTKLSKDHDRLLHELELTKNLADAIHSELHDEKLEAAHQHEKLTDKQKAIEESVRTLSGLSEEMRKLASENRDLRQRITVLELENSRQKSEMIELKMKPLEKRKDRELER